MGEMDEEEFKFVDSLYSKNYKDIFDRVCGNDNCDFEVSYFVYLRCRDTLTNVHIDELYLLLHGYTFEKAGLVDQDGEPITENSGKRTVWKALNNKFDLDIKLLDNFFYNYIKENGESKYLTMKAFNERMKKLDAYFGNETKEDDLPGKDHEKELFSIFPVFEKHSEILKTKGYYKIDRDKLTWKHGGNLLLAGYFGMIQDIPGNARNIWAPIEMAFNTKHLAQHYSDYETMRKGKTAKYDKYDKELRYLVKNSL